MSVDVDVDLDYLIALVQDRPPLWDKTSEDFSNRFQRANEWAAICKILFPEYDEFDDTKRNRIGNDVVKKWRSVKDNFFRYVKKTKENKESGLPAKKMKKYHYYNQLRFLLKVAHHKSDRQEDPGNSSTNRTPAMESSSPTKAPSLLCIMPSSKRARSGPDDIETEPSEAQEERENRRERHNLFFRAIMPTLVTFTDLQTLTFHSRLLQIITEMQFGPQTQNISSSSVGYQTAEHQHQSSSSSRRDINANGSDDSQEEFDFAVKIEQSCIR